MTDRFDIVVAGAGHNSLIAAAYLAKAGLRCLVLEGRAVAGGDCVTEELTLPGFRHDTCASAHVVLQDLPMLRNDELRLADYGLDYIFPEIVVHMPFPDGTSLTQWHDIDRTCAEFAKFSKPDAAAYRRMMDEFAAIKPVFDAAAYTPVGFGKALPERLGEHPQGRKWQRRIAMSAWEIIRDSFTDDHCRAFMLWMATQTAVPPEQPMSGRLAWSLCYGRQRFSWCVPKGGSGALTEALDAADRGAWRHGADGQVGAAADRRGWPLCRRRMPRRQPLSRREGGAFDRARQASPRHGAARGVGRGLHRRGRHLAGRVDDVRHPLRDHRAAAMPGRRRHDLGHRNRDPGRADPVAPHGLRFCPRRGECRRPAIARGLPDGRRSDPRAAGAPHAEGHRLPALRSRPRAGALGRHQGRGFGGASELSAPVRPELDR